ncbi:ABC transporter substrate-binding protein [Cytobacillus depressus]|uniref:ABC transporter substrate-binding protein n=1 Tax=Cytobacillus depressus TaxID=1602942 RepID=A0A6L3V676_9BACI|nr:ABC transporter substrate-binding protein [Cytobacillus depressus]KAB2336065.1 ABC transporter substrate-binding protein [Cytobacillus depressus]
MKKMLFLLLLVFSLILTACSAEKSEGKEGSKDSKKNNQDAIKIGWFGPLTGPTSTDGQISLNASQLAVDQINENGGINGQKVEIISVDDQGKPQEAAKGVQKLMNSDKVAAVISGAYSGPTLAAASLVQKAGVPMIVSYAKHPEATKGGDYVSRMIYTSDVQAKALADYAVNDEELKTFAIVYMNIDYGIESQVALEKEISELGGNVLVSKSFNMGDTDFNSALSAVKEKKPDALFVVAYYNEGASIVSQARQMGLESRIIGIDGLDAPKYLELAGEHAEGTVISTSFYKADEREIVQNFVKAYKEKFNTELSITASQSYDAVLAIKDAIERSSTDREDIAKAINSTKDLEGTSGSITIDENHEVVKPIVFMKVENGEFKYLHSKTY